MKLGDTILIDGIELEIMDEESQEIKNPYTGESCVLPPDAIALYDFIKGCEFIGAYKTMQKGLHAFRMRWPNEYMTLLD